MQAIGYGGQPTREGFRRVDPPRQPHCRWGRHHPLGLQMHGVVEAELTCWGLCEQGAWWGLVTYRVRFGTQQRPVTHWIPAWMLTLG